MSTNKTNQTKSVTLIGLGPMGQSMYRAYLAAGYSVTVWNRTKSKEKHTI